MTRKSTAWYPGKPGPQPTGLRRTIPLPLMLDADEFEYLNRLEEKHTKNGDGKSVRKAHIIRARVFHPGWRTELLEMRHVQGANLP